MGGLEVSEILLSQVLTASYSGRIDSTFFLKEYLNHKSFEFSYKLNQIANIKSGTTPADRDDDLKEGVMLLKTNNIRNNILNKYSDINYFIYEEVNKKMKSSELKEYDVLVNIVGATLDVVGRVGYVTNSLPKSNITQAMSFLRLKNEYKTDFIPAYLFIFLQSKFGKIQLNRHARPTGQYNLNNEELGAVRVIKLDISVQEKIEELVNISLSTLIESNQFYQSAQNLLLEHLGLKDFNPPTQTVNIKSFTDSFGTSGRLDAEFYQEKYESYLEKIQAFNNGFIQIQQEYSQVKSKSKFDLSAYQYIEIGDINVSDGSYSFNEVAIEDLPANAKIMVKKGDILISTVRPNRGAITVIEHDRDDLIVSGAFTVLRRKVKSYFNNEFLKVLLRTEIYKDWLLQFNVGTSYPVIKDEDILNLVIPNVEETIQTQIADLIRQSNYLRIKSKGLLEKAKKAVELAIEKNQESALDFIKGKQTNDCNVH